MKHYRRFQFGLRAQVAVPGHDGVNGLVVARTQHATAENSYKVEFAQAGTLLTGLFGESVLGAANPALPRPAPSAAPPQSVADFCAVSLMTAPGGRIAARALYHAYLAWALAHDRDPVTEKRFAMTMAAQVARDDTARVHQYLDIALKPPAPHKRRRRR